MAFRYTIIALCAVIACANGGIIASHYAVANPAVDAVAATHQNVVRSFDGTVSHHSKNVVTPYSSVSKVDTRISNNVYTPTIAKTVSYAAPAPLYTQATPVVHKSVEITPAITKTVYSAPAPVVTKSYAAPVVYSAPAPVVAKTVSYAAPAPVTYAKTLSYAAPAPAVTYAAPAPVVAKTVSYAAPAPVHYAAPAQVHYAAPAPVVAKTVSYAAPAPVHYAAPAQVHYAAPAPVLAKTVPVAHTTYNHGPAATTYEHSAPGISSYGSSQTVHYSPAEAVSHMSFDGFGTHWGF